MILATRESYADILRRGNQYPDRQQTPTFESVHGTKHAAAVSLRDLLTKPRKRR